MLHLSHPPRLDNEKDTIKTKAFASLNALGLIGDDQENLSDFSLKKIRKASTDLVDKKLITYVLAKTGWNRLRASKILKISYKTMLERIQELDIKRENGIKKIAL